MQAIEIKTFDVLITGDSVKSFKTSYDALNYVCRKIFLPAKTYEKAVKVLEQGESFSYSYGFNEAHICRRHDAKS